MQLCTYMYTLKDRVGQPLKYEGVVHTMQLGNLMKVINHIERTTF